MRVADFGVVYKWMIMDLAIEVITVGVATIEAMIIEVPRKSRMEVVEVAGARNVRINEGGGAQRCEKERSDKLMEMATTTTTIM